jgi:hypothetical protein
MERGEKLVFDSPKASYVEKTMTGRLAKYYLWTYGP